MEREAGLTQVVMKADSGCSRCPGLIQQGTTAYLDANYAAVCWPCVHANATVPHLTRFPEDPALDTARRDLAAPSPEAGE